MSATFDQIKEAITRTLEARERVVQHRPIDAIIDALAQAAQSWLTPDSPWAGRAVAEAPAVTGFSPEMVREAVALTFEPITREALGELLDSELGNRTALDGFCQRGQIQTRAIGPRLITHFLAGNVPAAGINSICRGLLLKSANLVKMSSRDTVFPALFVESLRAVDPELADCAAPLDWPRDEAPLTVAALHDADAVIACGYDQTIAELHSLAPAGAKFLGYGQQISFGVIAKEALTPENLPALAAAAAFDVSVYDQQGCLSPHLLYVEERGEVSPRAFAAALARAMVEYAARIPRGQLTTGEAAAFNTMRTGYEFRAAADRRVNIWTDTNTMDWAVVYEDDPSFAPSCLNRFVLVKPTDGFKRVLDNIHRFGGSISTVGVAPLSDRTKSFGIELGKLGINRVCALGQMQRPPLTWFHDGRPNLADLVRWLDVG